MHFVITGAAGYLGSHMTKLLQQKGHTLTLIDNLSNSDEDYANKIAAWPNCRLYRVDVTNMPALLDVVSQSLASNGPVAGLFHFAGLKSVDESVREPGRYYHNNVTGTINMLTAMKIWSCPTIIFSSSATVYGDSLTQPIPETESIKPTNPYGHSKAMCEQILLDASSSNSQLNVAVLRYFNPVGAHPDGDIGENPRGTPANLMPYLCQVALGMREKLTVFGDDYNTTDGSGVRDYIHVCDLIEGHWAAFNALSSPLAPTNQLVVNLGTGNGASVLELIALSEEVTGHRVNYTIGERRPGDVGQAVADTRRAAKLLNWTASRDLACMIADHFRFMKKGTTSL